MSLAGKIFSVIALVVAVFYAGITAALMSLQENFKQKWSDEKALHDRTKAEADRDRADLKTIIGQREGELARAKEEARILRGERDELRKEWEVAAGINRFAMQVINDQEDQIALLNSRVDRFNDDLKASRAESDAKQRQIEDLEAKGRKLLENRDALQELLTVREKDLTNALKEVEKLTGDLAVALDMLQRLKERDPETYTTLLKTDTQIRPKKVIRGKVTGVDKPLGLVILNIGQRHDVVKGYSFIVFRGDEYVGKIVVDEVFPDMSAAHYDKPSMKKDVEVGDDVTTRLTFDEL